MEPYILSKAADGREWPDRWSCSRTTEKLRPKDGPEKRPNKLRDSANEPAEQGHSADIGWSQPANGDGLARPPTDG